MSLKIIKVKTFVQKNLFNLALLLVLFNTSKTYFSLNYYVRGTFIDIYAPVIFLSYIIVIVLTITFINVLTKKDFILLISIILFFCVNFIFSTNLTYSLVYFLKVFFYLPFLLILIRLKPKVSIKFLTVVNLIYLAILVLQFITRSSVFPFFPFGFYSYDGLLQNMDFINLFGTKIVTPLGNFPHPNVFASFLSLLNIFHLKKSSPLFFVNVVAITILGSLAALVFNIILFIKYSYQSDFTNASKYFFYFYLFFLLTFFLLFQYKSVSLIERYNQFKISAYLFLNYPLFGVGASCFVYAITFFEEFKKRIYVLQPVHNIFLLFLVEYGLFGVAFVLAYLKKYSHYVKITPFLIFLIIFATFDHFFLTINQGILIATLTIYLHKSIINSNV